jgi:hypothetical protein
MICIDETYTNKPTLLFATDEMMFWASESGRSRKGSCRMRSSSGGLQRPGSGG